MSVLIHFPPTTNPAVRDLLDSAADVTRAKFNHFVSKHHVRRAVIIGEQSRVDEMGVELESLAQRIEQTKRDAARFEPDHSRKRQTTRGQFSASIPD